MDSSHITFAYRENFNLRIVKYIYKEQKKSECQTI